MELEERLNILILDDEEAITLLAKIVLENAGYNVDTANNPVDAFEQLKKNTYDLVISDYSMLDKEGKRLQNGVQFYQHVIKDMPEYASRWMFYSASTRPEEDVRFMEHIGLIKKTTNIFDLPEMVAERLQKQKQATAAEKHQKQTILVVDDDIHTRKLYEIILTQAGYNVAAASDGDEALKMLNNSHNFAAVVCDSNMPNLTGPEVYQKMPDKYKDRFLFVTGTPNENKLIKDVGYLQKPISKGGLLSAVERLVKNRSPYSSASQQQEQS